MNTESLARHYGKLKPRERFPLLVAAFERGDEAERERLLQTAPRVTFGLPDYWGIATAFDSLANFTFLTLLDLAGQYLRAFDRAAYPRREGDEDPLEGWDEVLLVGYEFLAHLEGWRSFCRSCRSGRDSCGSNCRVGRRSSRPRNLQ